MRTSERKAKRRGEVMECDELRKGNETSESTVLEKAAKAKNAKEK